jgi:Flp pilus assembly protein TadD
MTETRGPAMSKRSRKALLPALAVALALAGCQTTDLSGTNPFAPAATRAVDEPKDDLFLGKEHFRAANYGLAEAHFRRAVEANGDPEAWLGLAASYDRLRRFDLADRAYAQAEPLVGGTAAFLNNRGYSYLLRGDLARARRDLAAARSGDPENETIRNNLATSQRARRG